MKSKHLIAASLSVAGALLLTGCVSKMVVRKLDHVPAGRKLDGVFYALPKTIVQAQTTMTRSKSVAGKYVRFVPPFFPELDTGDYIEPHCTQKAPCFSFKLEEEAALSLRQEADLNEIYMIQVRGGFFEDRSLNMTLASDGRASKVDASVTNQALDFALEFVKPAIGIFSKSFRGVPKPTEAPIQADELRSNEPSLTEDSAEKAADALNKDTVKARFLGLPSEQQAALLRSVDALGVGVLSDPDIWDALSRFGEMQLWEKRREDILTSQAPQPSLAKRLEEIDAKLGEIGGKNFFGSKTDDKWTALWELEPETGDSLPWQRTLFEFSSSGGICAIHTSNLKNPPQPPPGFYNSCSGDQMIDLALHSEPEQLSDALVEKDFDQSGSRGLRYRVPAQVTGVLLRLASPAREIVRKRLEIAQLGATFSLPDSTGGRKTQYTMDLHDSGALKNFVMGAEALLNAAAGEKLAAASEELATAVRGPDEVTVKEEQKKLLEAEVAILEAQKRLEELKKGKNLSGRQQE